MIKALFETLNNYSAAITSLSVVIAGIWALIKFSDYLKDKRFNNYHRLIKELVDGDDPDVALRLDRQIALIFELRNYPSYYKVTRRILLGLKASGWNEHSPRLGEEINLTLSYIDRLWRKPWFK